jgi:hypothetical protein
LLKSGSPGDKARFFEGDALRDGAGDGCESLTGTCVIFFPRRVCVVAGSNMSDLDPESLIFGILCGGLKVEVI